MYVLEDKKIIFDSNELFAHLPRLGFGGNSDVYKFRIGKEIYALKVFNGLREENIENYERKLKLDIESYISPKKLLYVKDKFSGYIMKYCKGGDLQKRKKLNITIDEFVKSSTKLFYDTNLLSNLNYVIFDTYITNVMYDDGFKMIDLDDYRYEKNVNIDEIKKINNKRLNNMLVTIFINTTNLAALSYTDIEFTKIINRCNDGSITFEELFNDLCMKAYKISDKELINVEEIGKVLTKKLR